MPISGQDAIPQGLRTNPVLFFCVLTYIQTLLHAKLYFNMIVLIGILFCLFIADDFQFTFNLIMC